MKGFAPAILAAVAMLAFGGSARAACMPREVAVCDLAEAGGACDPVTLRYWVAEDGAAHCERLSVVLPASKVYPILRQLHCSLISSDTRVRFSASNYRTRRGPKDGESQRVQGGASQVEFVGQYGTTLEPSQIGLVNDGPGAALLVTCFAFGPP